MGPARTYDAELDTDGGGGGAGGGPAGGGGDVQGTCSGGESQNQEEKNHKMRYTFGPGGVPNEFIDLGQRLNDGSRCPINKFI